MAGLNLGKGLNAYNKELSHVEQSQLSEPNQILDEFANKAAAAGYPLQEKSTLKGLAGTDLRHRIPPQMFAIVSSLAKMIEWVETGEQVHE